MVKPRIPKTEDPPTIPAVRANIKVLVSRVKVFGALPLQVACSVRPASVSVSPLWGWALGSRFAKRCSVLHVGKGMTGRGRAVLLAKPARED